jgi:hypothetical protein
MGLYLVGSHLAVYVKSALVCPTRGAPFTSKVVLLFSGIVPEKRKRYRKRFRKLLYHFYVA